MKVLNKVIGLLLCFVLFACQKQYIYTSSQYHQYQPVTIVVGNDGLILKSVNDVSSWQEVKIEGYNQIHFNAIAKNNKTFSLAVVGTKGTILFSDNVGATWQKIKTNYDDLTLTSVIAYQNSFIAAGYDSAGNSLLLTFNKNGIITDKTITSTTKDINKVDVAFNLELEQLILVNSNGTDSSVYISNDGENWTPIKTSSVNFLTVAVWGGKYFMGGLNNTLVKIIDKPTTISFNTKQLVTTKFDNSFNSISCSNRYKDTSCLAAGSASTIAQGDINSDNWTAKIIPTIVDSDFKKVSYYSLEKSYLLLTNSTKVGGDNKILITKNGEDFIVLYSSNSEVYNDIITFDLPGY